MLQNPNLTVVNATSKCEGSITRERNTTKKTEKSILDFFIVCERIFPFVSKMVIDENGGNDLFRYRGGKIVKADHHMLKLNLDITIHEKKKHERIEMFNVRNKLCLKDFKDFTTNTNRFTKCFQSEETFEIQFQRWQRQLQKALHANFRKIRHKENDHKKLQHIDVLMNKKKDILKKKNLDMKDKDDIELLDKNITDECEEKEWEKLNEILGNLDSKDTNINIWKQMKKAYPKKTKPLPTGVKNMENKIVTNPEEKKSVILEHFRHRMRKRPVHSDVKDIIDMNKCLFQERIKYAKNVKSSSFTLQELENTLKSLKVGKSRDPENLVTELFKEGSIGEDLKLSILYMMNKMKDQLKVPESIRTATITMLHKKKCKLDLKNWRGIFVTSVIRTILMKMLHERSYEKVTYSMTDSQIGARRKKSVRNHVFFLF